MLHNGYSLHRMYRVTIHNARIHALARPIYLGHPLMRISRLSIFRSQSSTAFNEAPTVYALSTAPGRSAIAIIRVTGPLCKTIYSRLCPSKPLPHPRTATLRTLYHPKSASQASTILDPKALLLFFPSPNSFTGEDLLELHIHGGPAITKAILSTLPACHPNIRPAEPGDFTRRAFHNNRLTLPQIEALGQQLAAETELQRKLSINASSTKLTQKYESWRNLLLSARGELEALIDFSEDQQFEDSPATLLQNVTMQVIALHTELRDHVTHAVKGELLRNGINLAVFGAPNAGKSSLLNKIVGREAVIVNSKAGTTRDVIDVAVDINGYMVIVGDTAGLRVHESVDEVEEEGIRRARNRVLEADVVVLLVAMKKDSMTEKTVLALENSVVQLANQVLEMGKQLLVVVNKMDLMDGQTALPVQDLQTQIPSLEPSQIIGISCTSKSPALVGSIQHLLTRLTRVFEEMTTTPEEWTEAIGATMRQKALVEECMFCLDRYMTYLDEDPEGEKEVDVVIMAEELRRAADCMARITGRGMGAGDVEAVLGVVFERQVEFPRAV